MGASFLSDLPRLLEAGFDLAQHRNDLRRARLHCQNRLAFLHGERERANVKICLGQTTRDSERLLGFAEFVVRDLEDLQRLIIVLLCLSNDLKHLNRLENLAAFLF